MFRCRLRWRWEALQARIIVQRSTMFPVSEESHLFALDVDVDLVCDHLRQPYFHEISISLQICDESLASHIRYE